MPFQCWSIVFDAGPTLKQHWVNALCLLGRSMCVFVKTFTDNITTAVSIMRPGKSQAKLTKAKVKIYYLQVCVLPL